MIGHGNASPTDAGRCESATGAREPPRASSDASTREQSTSNRNPSNSTTNINNRSNQIVSNSSGRVDERESMPPPLNYRWDSESDSEVDTEEESNEAYDLRDQIRSQQMDLSRPVYAEVLRRMEQQSDRERSGVISGSGQAISWDSDDDDPCIIINSNGRVINQHDTKAKRFDITEQLLGRSLEGVPVAEQNQIILEALEDKVLNDRGDNTVALPAALAMALGEHTVSEDQLIRFLLSTREDTSDSSYVEEGSNSSYEILGSNSTSTSFDMCSDSSSGDSDVQSRGSAVLKDPPEWLTEGNNASAPSSHLRRPIALSDEDINSAVRAGNAKNPPEWLTEGNNASAPSSLRRRPIALSDEDINSAVRAGNATGKPSGATQEKISV